MRPTSEIRLLNIDSDAQRIILSFLAVEERLAARTVCREWSLLVNPRERHLRLERLRERFGTLQEALEQAVQAPTDAVADVALLLAAPGVDAAAQDNLAIRWAARNGHLDVVEHLLTVPGVDAAARDNLAIRLAA